MKKIYYALIFTIIFAFCIAFSSCQKENDSEENRKSRGQQQVLLREIHIESSPSPSPSPPAFTFLVRLDNSTLTLFEVSEQGYNAIKSLDIDTSYYPYEDIQELIKGIPAYSKERGFEILENFIN